MSHKRIVSFDEKKKSMQSTLKYVTPTMSLANLPRDFYESGFDYDAIIEMFDMLDESVNKAAVHANVPEYVKFWMPQECFEEILSVGLDMFMYGEPIVLEYYCEPIDEKYNDHYSYMAAVSIFCVDPETGNAESNTAICREAPDGTMQRIRQSDQTWADDKTLTEMSKLFAEDGHETECRFLTQLSNYLFSHPFALADWSMKVLQQNKPLIKLYNRLDGLADFDFVIKENGTQKDDLEKAIKVMLVPDDAFRSGGAIHWENGKYHLCQYLTEEDDWDAIEAELEDCELYYTDPDGNPIVKGKTLKPREYQADVFITDDATKIIRAVKFMWDRYYNGDEAVFTFPLSESAYAEGGRPYHRLRVYTYGGKRDLTIAEEGNMNKLRKRFGLRNN